MDTSLHTKEEKAGARVRRSLFMVKEHYMVMCILVVLKMLLWVSAALLVDARAG